MILGLNFYERNYDGTLQTQFLTRPLWGVGTTAPYGHDGRSITLEEVILRHGGEAQASRMPLPLEAEDQKPSAGVSELAGAVSARRHGVHSRSGRRTTPDFPQFGHGSIKLTVLFNDPTDPE